MLDSFKRKEYSYGEKVEVAPHKSRRPYLFDSPFHPPKPDPGSTSTSRISRKEIPSTS